LNTEWDPGWCATITRAGEPVRDVLYATWILRKVGWRLHSTIPDDRDSGQWLILIEVALAQALEDEEDTLQFIERKVMMEGAECVAIVEMP
jgi:hypothetical protein